MFPENTMNSTILNDYVPLYDLKWSKGFAI